MGEKRVPLVGQLHVAYHVFDSGIHSFSSLCQYPTKMREFRADLLFVVNRLLPHPDLPYEIRRLILEMSGLIHVGNRSLVWFHHF